MREDRARQLASPQVPLFLPFSSSDSLFDYSLRDETYAINKNINILILL